MLRHYGPCDADIPFITDHFGDDSMLTRAKMKGLYAIPPTPFTKAGEFDEEAFRNNCRAHIEAGVDAIVITGSNGEFHTMPWDMLKRMFEVFAEETRDKVTSVAGASAVNTEDAIIRTRYAQDLGIDAVMNVSPYYIDLTREELVGFWRDLSAACPNIGLIIYNNPGTAQMHPPDLLEQLAEELPNFVGTKEGHGEWDHLLAVFRDSRKSDVSYMTATDLTWWVTAMQAGSKGIFSMASSVFPKFCVKLQKACESGDWETAWQMQWRLRDAYQGMASADCLKGYNMMARFKAMCNAGGVLRCGKNRKPLISVSDADQEKLNAWANKHCGDIMG